MQYPNLYLGVLAIIGLPAVDALWVDPCLWRLWDLSSAFGRSFKRLQNLLAGFFQSGVNVRPKVFGRTAINTELVTIFFRKDCELKRLLAAHLWTYQHSAIYVDGCQASHRVRCRGSHVRNPYQIADPINRKNGARGVPRSMPRRSGSGGVITEPPIKRGQRSSRPSDNCNALSLSGV
jgi:hypothetical protein